MHLRTMSQVTIVMAGALLAALALALLINSSPALSEEPVTQIVYVDADVAAGGNGQSWSRAYRTLQDALDEANASGSNRYEIWVAEGVYTPDEDDDGDHVSGVVTETFLLSFNNVQLYGGFAGAETAREQRDWEANVTVLSGDIDGNDITDAHGVVIDAADINGDNAYHVLWLDGETSEPITGTTVIDGFTITAGQADSSWPRDDDGGGMVCAGSGGGAECSPTLNHVIFSGNSAQQGGAMYNGGHSSGVSSPTLVNVTFSGNSATGAGGAMYNLGAYLGMSSPTLTNVTFSGNSAGSGGAVFSDGGAETPVNTLRNFGGNSLTWQGSAIASDLPQGTSSPTLANVILWGNSADGAGDQMCNWHATPTIGYSLVQGGWDGSGISNDWGGTVIDNGGNIDADPHFLDAEGGNLRLQLTSPAIDAGDNSAVPSGVTTDADGNSRFVDIIPVSDTGSGAPPIVDMGAYEAQVPGAPHLGLSKAVAPETGAALQGTITYTVVLKNFGMLSDTHVLVTDTLPAQASFGTWIEQPSGAVVRDDVVTWSGTVDGGASITFAYHVHYTSDGYGDVLTNTAEFSGTLQAGRAQATFAVEPPLLYVDGDAIGATTGLSWTDAYTTVQDALDRTNAHASHAYQIWVAEGIYTPDEDGDGDHISGAVTETFRISFNNVQLYGGFAGGETARDQRDWETNATVLSGDIDGNDTTDVHGVVIDAAGISGRNAYHVLWLDGETHEPIIDTTIIDGFNITAGQADGSQRDDTGGGMLCAGSGIGGVAAECSPALAHVTFSGNWARFGGAMHNDGYSGASNPTLIDVAFTGNWADGGGAIFNDGAFGSSSPTLTNVTFCGNSTESVGGAIYNSASTPTLTNIILWGNSASEHGDQMFNARAAPAIGYSLVEGGWDGTGIYNKDSSVTDNGGNIDADPQFLDAEAGNLRLRWTSPAIDAGDNSAVPSGVTTDLGGNPRFVDIPTVADTGSGTPPIVDIGAYEVQNDLQNRVYLPLVLRNHR